MNKKKCSSSEVPMSMKAMHLIFFLKLKFGSIIRNTYMQEVSEAVGNVWSLYSPVCIVETFFFTC